MIIVLALLLGCANAVDMPVRQAFAVEMVGREDIGNVVALNSAMFNGARMVGPAVAGLTIGRSAWPRPSRSTRSASSRSSSACSRCATSELRTARLDRSAAVGRARCSRTCARASTTSGAPHSYCSRSSSSASSSTFGMNFSVVIPTLTQETLDSDAAGYGFLMAASGVGSLLAALWLAFGGNPRPTWMAGGAAVLGIGEVLLAVSHVVSALDAADGRRRVGAIAMAATANTTIQLAVARPAARPRHERLHDDLRGLHPDRRPADGARRSPRACGIGIAMAVGGALSARGRASGPRPAIRRRALVGHCGHATARRRQRERVGLVPRGRRPR